jgi:hypothetical protein
MRRKSALTNYKNAVLLCDKKDRKSFDEVGRCRPGRCSRTKVVDLFPAAFEGIEI